MAVRRIHGRISEYGIGSDGLISVKLFDEDRALYNSNAIGDVVSRPGYANEEVRANGSTILRLMDITTLRDEDDGPGFYVAVRGAMDTWSAAILFESPDETVDYAPITSLDQPAAIGFTRSVLADGSPTTWDYNTVDVELIGGTLESLSADDALRAEVAFLIGDEVVLCQAVTQLSANVWRLTGPLVRGWRGTECKMASHVLGERFIALGPTITRRINDELADLDLERSFKCVTSGQAIDAALAQPFTDTGESLRPYAPVDIDGSFDGGDNVVLTWRRRSRLIGRNGRDFFDPPLGEASEAYEVDILSDDETTVLRTLTSTTPTASYDDGDQITDFGGLKEFNLHVNIYQISAEVGRGHAGHAILNPGGTAEGALTGFLYEDGNVFLFEDDEAFLFED
jgi:hypothetical protein